MDREHQLLVNVLRKLAAALLANDVLERADELLPALGAEFGIGLHAEPLFLVVDEIVEMLFVDVEHDAREHHDEAAVRIPCEAIVAR